MQLHGATRRPATLAVLAAAALGVLVPAAGRAASGDSGTASYRLESGSSDTYDVTIANTGDNKHLYDYVRLPAGYSISACAIVSGPAESTCTVNGGGPRTAEANLGSGGLAKDQSVVFSFTAAKARRATTRGLLPCGLAIEAFGNSDGNPADYYPLEALVTDRCADLMVERLRLDVIVAPAARGHELPRRLSWPVPGSGGVSFDDLLYAAFYTRNLGPDATRCLGTFGEAFLAAAEPCAYMDAPLEPNTSDSGGHLLRFAPGLDVPGQNPQTLTVSVMPTDAIETDPTTNTGTFNVMVFGTTAQRPRVSKPAASGVGGSLVGNTVAPRSLRAASPTKRVEVAVAAANDTTCRWRKRAAAGGFTAAKPVSACDPPVWLAAKGTAHWSLRFKPRLPRGRYVVMARTVDAAGSRSGGFTGERKTVTAFTVG